MQGKGLGYLIGLGMVLGITTPAIADIEAGARKYEAGDYSGAIAEWLPYAAQNEPNALFNLGQAYRLGRGVNVDLAKSANFYERAANLGHISAKANLGTVLYFSPPPLQNKAKAIDWWSKAAEFNEPRALYMLGVLHFNGDEMPRDWPRAYALTKAASEAGVPEARDALREMEQFVSADDKTQALALNIGSSKTPAATDLAISTPPAPTPKGLPAASAPVDLAQVTQSRAKASPPQATLASTAPAAAKPAQAAPVAAATGTPTAAGDSAWRVQVGAFSSADRAASAWSQLQAASGQILASLKPVYQPAGAMTRLQIAGFQDKSAAQSTCARLQNQKQTCFVVKSD